MNRRSLIISLSVIVSILGLAMETLAHSPSEPGVIRFGVFPYKSPKAMVELFAPIATRLQERLGVKVQLVTAPDAESFIERGRNLEYDLALPCVACFFKMKPGSYRVIAKGSPTFHGGVLVRKESEIQNVSQLRGKKVAAIGPHSYGGYLFLRAQLEEAGINPDQDVNFQFLGKMDTVMLGVANGGYDAGVIRTDALDSPSFASIRDQLRVVSRSIEIPQFPFVVREGMDDKTVSIIREVLTSFSPQVPADAEVLQSLQIRKIEPAGNADYERVHDLIKNLPYFK